MHTSPARPARVGQQVCIAPLVKDGKRYNARRWLSIGEGRDLADEAFDDRSIADQFIHFSISSLCRFTTNRESESFWTSVGRRVQKTLDLNYDLLAGPFRSNRPFCAQISE